MHGRQSKRILRLPGDTSHTAPGVLGALLARRWLRLLLSAILLASVLGTVVWAVVPALASHQTATATATLYGANNAKVQSAVRAAGWPQQKNNWCGVATIAAIAQYRGHAVSQTAVATFLNSPAAVSAWGTPPPAPNYFGPGFQADIAGDVGTDPRSLAEGLTVEAQGSYHQLVDPGTNYDATVHLVADLVRTGEPISVIVFHGLHSVLVSGVWATANPVTDPGSIVALDVWDPGYGIPNGNIQAAQEAYVHLSTWLTSSYYWGSTYSANYYGSIASDPDPAVGAPYTNNPSQGDDVHLWVTHYVYLRPDASTAADIGVSADWAISPSGALIAGQHGEVPQVTTSTGAVAPYSGPEVTLPALTHLSYESSAYTSIDGPALWTNSTYPPVTNSTLPMSVLAWTGTNSLHSLNISTSVNGVTYGNHLTLGFSSFTRPSVLVVPVGTNWMIDLAWVGTSSPHTISVLYNAYGEYSRVTLGSSNYAPSLAYFKSQVWIAWVGTNNTLNVEPLGAKGITPGARRTVPSATSTQAPSLTSDTADGKLLLSWEDAGGAHHFNSKSSSDGVTWTAGVESSTTLQSLYTPALQAATSVSTASPPVKQVAYAWCWTVEDLDRSVDIMYLAQLSTWSGPVTNLLLSSLGAPALGYVGAKQELLVAWTETSGQGIDVAFLPASG